MEVPLNNRHNERVFVAGGCASGVAAAFSAPIAGVLLARDQQASFWTQTVTVRAFVCCLVAVYFTSMCNTAGWSDLR